MCGRYAATRSSSQLVETFEIDWAKVDEQLAPDYNVAPTKTSPVVVAITPKDQPEEEPARQLRNLR